ncbi:MAG: Gfo/Idh/MocA family oxidoreductase [Victivallaceae bacterium]|nr:Gfo/Idh/MocA family oxidoreductase [Victivallaceae bacterium]
MTSEQKYHNIVVVGAGGRCGALLPLFAERDDCNIVAIIEKNKDNHQKVKGWLDKYECKETLLLETLEELSEVSLFKKDQISQYDMAFIFTPEWTHADIFEQLVSANFNVFIEKPLATTKEEVLKIEELTQKTDRVVQVGFVMRYSPFYQTVKQTVDSGKLGQLVMIEMSERLLPIHGASNRRRWHRLIKNTGGFLNEKSSHDLDMMCWLKANQGVPVRLFSHGGQSFFNRNVTAKKCAECDEMQCPYRFKGFVGDDIPSSYNAPGKVAPDTCVYNSDADIMDNQSVTISFSDGTQGIFTLLNVSGVDGREIRIHGTEGMLYGNTKSNELTLHEYKGDIKRQLPIPESSSGHGGGDAVIIDKFFQCVKAGEQSMTTVSDGVKASLLAFAADKSVRIKQSVTL